MSDSDALLNLTVLLVAMTPLSLLSWWIIRKTPIEGQSSTGELRAYRIRIGAGAIIVINIGLLLYILLNLLL